VEATRGKRRVALSRSKLLGGVTVGGDEPEIGIPQLAANSPGRVMDGGRGRPLGLVGLALGTLGQDGCGSERLDSGALPARGSFPLDLRHQRGDLLLPLLRSEVLPAGQRIELQRFAGRILEGTEVFGRRTGLGDQEKAATRGSSQAQYVTQTQKTSLLV
jgi:hypothetical protein